MCPGRGESAGTACFLLFLLVPSACEDVLAPRACSSSCSVRIQGAVAGEAAANSWNSLLQHCLLHCSPVPARSPVRPCCCAVPSEQPCQPWRGTPGAGPVEILCPWLHLWPRGKGGGMGSASAIEKHSTQKSFTVASDVPRGFAVLSPPCVSVLQGWPCLSTGKFSHTLTPAVPAPALAASPPFLGQSRFVLALTLLQGARQNCGTWQQFWVVLLVLPLPANPQGSVDALLQGPSSSSNAAVAGARDQGTRAQRSVW